LNQLEDYRVYNSKGGIERTLTQNYAQIDRKMTITDYEFDDEEDTGVLNLKRRVIVKQYAPETFKRIRSLNNI